MTKTSLSELSRPLLAERAEDLTDAEVLKVFQASPVDDRIVRLLGDSTPRLIVGSRGTGKSMLLRYAQLQLLRELRVKQTLPVYVNFHDYLLLDPLRSSPADSPGLFRSWVTAKVTVATLKAVVSLRPDSNWAPRVPDSLPSDKNTLIAMLDDTLSKVRRESLADNAPTCPWRSPRVPFPPGSPVPGFVAKGSEFLGGRGVVR